MCEPEIVTVDGLEFQLLKMPLLEARTCDAKIARILVPLLGALDAFGNSKGDDAPVESDPGKSALAALPEGVTAEPPEAPAAEDSTDDIKDFSLVAQSIQRALSSLPDSVMDALMKSMLSRVTCLNCEDGPLVLNNSHNIDKAFDGLGPVSLYKLIYEVARFNKFTPFVLAGAGDATGGILASLVPGGIRKGLSLARLGG